MIEYVRMIVMTKVLKFIFLCMRGVYRQICTNAFKKHLGDIERYFIYERRNQSTMKAIDDRT